MKNYCTCGSGKDVCINCLLEYVEKLEDKISKAINCISFSPAALAPDDVYDGALRILKADMSDNGKNIIADKFEPDDIFTEDKIKDYIRNNFRPEDIFEPFDLAEWAEDNGWEC